MPAPWVRQVVALLTGVGQGIQARKQREEEKRKTRAAEELAKRQVAVSEKAEARQERMTVAEISALTANTIFRKEELGLQTRDQLFREGMGAAENLFRYYGFTWDREKFYKGLELDLYKYENVSGGEKAQIDLQTLIHRTASAGAKLQSKTQKELVGLQGMETRETARLGAALGIGSELELFGAQEEILRGLLPEGAYEKIVAGGKGPALLPGGRTWQRAIPPSDVTTEAARAQSYGVARGQITGQVAGYKAAGIPPGRAATALLGIGGGGGSRRSGGGGGAMSPLNVGRTLRNELMRMDITEGQRNLLEDEANKRNAVIDARKQRAEASGVDPETAEIQAMAPIMGSATPELRRLILLLRGGGPTAPRSRRHKYTTPLPGPRNAPARGSTTESLFGPGPGIGRLF